MASFPTSVKSWTALVDGSDYPQAAHLNEARDEITAIETGYLNGTAPLNSSNSTVANLSVTGVSTLASLNVTGGSTLASVTVSSNATVNGLIRSTGQTHAVVYATAVHDLPDATWTGISFDAEDLDVGGMHSTATNSSRVTIPTGSSGVYLLSGVARNNASSVGSFGLQLQKNDTVALGTITFAANTPNVGAAPTITAVVSLNAADYVTLLAYQNSGSTMSFGSTSDRTVQPQLSVIRMF